MGTKQLSLHACFGVPPSSFVVSPLLARLSRSPWSEVTVATYRPRLLLCASQLLPFPILSEICLPPSNFVSRHRVRILLVRKHRVTLGFYGWIQCLVCLFQQTCDYLTLERVYHEGKAINAAGRLEEGPGNT